MSFCIGGIVPTALTCRPTWVPQQKLSLALKNSSSKSYFSVSFPSLCIAGRACLGKLIKAAGKKRRPVPIFSLYVIDLRVSIYIFPEITQLFPKQNYNILSPSSYNHISVRYLCISRIGLPILLQENMWTNPGNIKIAHRHMNVEIGTEAAHRVGNFRQKNNSAEVGIDGTNGYFRRNSGCSAEQNSQNSVPNPSTEEKTTRNSVPLNKNKSKLSEFPSNTSAEEKRTWNSVRWNKKRRILSEFPSELFRRREKNSEFRSEPFRGRANYSEQNAAAQILKIVPEKTSWSQ